ncbi:hypothetical protein HH310_19695 [Actinoplanes sp. TBRC 11911]|uniref:hypothetical protein n=1 Tax=Actinoplanes sp. TBRC 11911 TaxID=2729386 RepID=UPI00145FAB60|nr:hypothetical protein [Actinoplanes sp. TBRC 11911]NMO53401.1 hypothetical protein [Actinoplanes sp. TBRC 11911]
MAYLKTPPIDERATRDELDAGGCHAIQGYYISRPVALPAIRRMARTADHHQQGDRSVRVEDVSSPFMMDIRVGPNGQAASRPEPKAQRVHMTWPGSI